MAHRVMLPTDRGEVGIPHRFSGRTGAPEGPEARLSSGADQARGAHALFPTFWPHCNGPLLHPGSFVEFLLKSWVYERAHSCGGMLGEVDHPFVG